MNGWETQMPQLNIKNPETRRLAQELASPFQSQPAIMFVNAVADMTVEQPLELP